jgi:hypothetical protein
MSRRMRKFLLGVLALLALGGIGGCGDSHTKVTTGTYAGESGANAPYLDVGPLTYEVQLSRQLSPFDTEDAAYLQGLTSTQRALGRGEEWFAVFMQVYNNTSASQLTASTVTISDTQGNTYAPVLPDQTNQFAYRGGTLAANGRLPVPDSIAAAGPTQGALLLYKIQINSLDNRPLTVRIVDANDASQTASAELDV